LKISSRDAFFSKYSGLGNNFIFVDNREKKFPVDQVFIQNLCDRHEGIGADGVVLVENSDQADCRMLIFNADGSEAEMCGNALRCLYLFRRIWKYKKLILFKPSIAF